MATDAPTMTDRALGISRRFTRPGVHPYDEVAWGPRDARIVEPARDGKPERVVFEQTGCEFPLDWSDTAVRIVASKYFRYGMDDPRRERSLREVIDRVVDTIRHHGVKGGYFADDDEAETFSQELRHILVTQKAAFNSPVWFNCGVSAATREHDPDRILDVDDPPVEPGEPQVNQASACFILSVNDTMPSIQRWIASESEIFRGGSGAGVNLSRLRGDGEALSNGGQASGPVSFMRWADSGAGSIKSGGGTRRAAKMVILDGDHPDILEFVRCKAHEEAKAYALGDMGYDLGLNGDAWRSIQFQNANNSVRLTDDFFRRVEAGETWQTRNVAGGEVRDELPAADLLREISEAAWACGDPGVQYEDAIQRWHTSPNAGRISGSNPCSEYMHIDDSACNLASINLMEFLDEDGTFRIDDFRHAVRVVLTAQEIIVTPASYPTKRIGDNARAFRQLGQGFTNLGSLLMCQGLAYDSDEGRAWAGAITALLQGEAYAQSARVAARVGAYDGYAADQEAQDRVVRMHRDAALDLPVRARGGNYAELRAAAAHSLDDAVALGQSEGRIGAPGYRNAQVSVIAPTGTISFMMDAQTTGIEPSIGLISYKTLVGGGYMKLVNTDVERALRALGYDAAQRAEIMAHVDATGAIEGAPGLAEEHLPVFDCAFGVPGGRTIGPEGHVRMMAAVQPFVSGAISKTVNLPNSATVEDVSEIYKLGWRLGLKAIAIYRDGSKRTQPLSTTDGSAAGAGAEGASEAAAHVPVRRRLPDDRAALTHKFSVGGQEGYITVGLYEDGTPGEVFVKMSKQGSTVSGLMDSVAIAWSMALQHGVPVESLIAKYIDHRFEPSGFTGNPRIPMARSVVDYLARWMASKFLSEEDQRTAGVLPSAEPVAPEVSEEEREVPDDQLSFAAVAEPGMREAVEPGLVEAEAARVQGVRERLEAGVLPRATSLDGRTFTFSAPVDMPLQIGGYVRLGTPGVPGLGQVLDRRLQREPGPEVTGDAGPGGYRTRVAFSLTAGHGVVLGEAGPFHDAPITLAGPHDVAAHLAEARPGRARLELGEAMFAPGVPVELDAGGFSRHTFLCGQSGSGKSYALGVVLEQLLMHTGLRIVVLDPNSDYVPLDRARDDAPAEAAARWHELAPAIGPRSLGGQGDRRLRLRFFDLDPATMAAVVRLDPLADREEYGAFLELLEQEGRGRALDELRAQLAGSASPELGRLGDRIRNLGVLGWRSWSASREDGGILDELDRRDMRCLVVDLGSISRPDERAMVSAAVLGRIWARRGDREPVLVVIDEAHNVCPRAPGDPLTALATDVAVRIAAEGRKYGIYLLACTQRPQKVHENVVGQCDNLMLMRMNSPADVAHLAEVFSFAPTTLLQRSGVLRLGEALVAGHVAPHPMFVRVGRRVAAEGGGDVPATWAASPG